MNRENTIKYTEIFSDIKDTKIEKHMSLLCFASMLDYYEFEPNSRIKL